MASRLTGVVALALCAAATCSPSAAAPAAGFRFDSHGVSRVTAKELGKSWHRGCPVPPRDLRALRVHFWGFDRARHSGVLIVNAAAVPAVRAAFAKIAHSHFPIRRIEPVSNYDGSDNKSMNHDNTSAFNCRYAVANGPKSWSEHAYGEAVDIDPRENPYTLNGKIYPPSGAAYVDRSKH
ncbi:MAG: M15 family metallopeptidase, partial [Mycobacteriales bacterium]